MAGAFTQNGEALRHRRFGQRQLIWLAPLAGTLAIASFPAAAGAAGPCSPTATIPCNTAPPTITPASEVASPPEGRILTATQGTWYGTAPLKYSYQWQRCDAASGVTCVNIAGATARTYTAVSADVGSRLQIVEKATNSAGRSAQTAQTGIVVVGTPINRSAPRISGPAQTGQTLTVAPGTWVGTMPISYAYQWRRCDSSGAHCGPRLAAPSPVPNYAVQAGDLGHSLVAYVTATNSVGSSSVHSRPTAVITAATPAPPTSGPGHPGGTVKVSPAKIRALLMGVLGHGRRARIGALLKRGGYSFLFAAPSAGRLVISWYHRSPHGKKTRVATVTFVFHKRGTARIKLALTGRGRRLLTGARKLKLTGKGAFTPAGQVTTSASRGVTLKR
jgi:hypothetical protein